MTRFLLLFRFLLTSSPYCGDSLDKGRNQRFTGESSLAKNTQKTDYFCLSVTLFRGRRPTEINCCLLSSVFSACLSVCRCRCLSVCLSVSLSVSWAGCNNKYCIWTYSTTLENKMFIRSHVLSLPVSFLLCFCCRCLMCQNGPVKGVRGGGGECVEALYQRTI